MASSPWKAKNVSVNREESKNWQHKDIIEDTIPGISLDKAYRELLKNKKGNKIIVAVIDEVVDAGHQDLKNQFWINENEIPNNGIDDDANGYIDDVQGWNFIGNSKGEHIIYANMESVRIIRKFGYKFKDFKDGDSIKDKNFILYKKALKEYAVLKKDMKEELDYIVYLPIGFQKAKDAVKKFFPNEKYELAKLDSLYSVYQNTDKVLAKHIYY
ncbi:hypothetical protein FK004_03245 [Flavobacterium kingsejongi]|uniref:Uncharacterized protein n=1 Tax=Flavobacterium kingsejongi TaxID=1678728 RepID=A0A2S1LKT3_9FLAO|nr:hypothetical protein FK004_03245 [Flavobacterium kingsejongi]